MKIQALSLKNFTAFSEATFEFSPGLNVLIGENGTGKSHVLKASYALLRATDSVAQLKEGNGFHLTGAFEQKFQAVFRPAESEIDRLTCRLAPDSSAQVVAKTEAGAAKFTFTGPIAKATLYGTLPQRVSSLFLPARDALALYEGFIAAYQNRELSLDETYYDLCVALSASPLKGTRAAWGNDMLEKIEKKLLRGQVQLKGGRFYVGKLEAHLVGEGLRKVAMLAQLLRNGGLTKETILFWDEPEAGLNPKLVTVVADLLLSLASEGLQIVIATHDYLLANELSLQAEYKTEAAQNAQIKFFCLGRPKPSSGVEAQGGDTLSDLADDPILAEFAAHHDREQSLFYGSQK